VVEAMANRPPMDFWLMVSSLSSVLGGLGFSAYAGANSFIDCYAATRPGRSASRWISVDWDAWDFTEPATVTAIQPAEGQDTFMRVMGSPDLSRVVVSVAPLQSRLDRWANLRSLCGTTGRRIAPEAESHPRPDAAGDYLAPTSALERELAAMWQEILGIEQVGINDNFFGQLGGHSLLATQLISQIRTRYGVDLPLPAFFERPTVQGLSEIVTLLRSDVNGDSPPQPAPIRRGRLTRAVLQGDELQTRQ
jgi:phthiocerol/phenolphthiocerol synthesis type-I polyketide synthase E